MTNEPFKGVVKKMVANKGSAYHESYIVVRQKRDAIITEDLNLRKIFHTVFFIDINFQ